MLLGWTVSAQQIPVSTLYVENPFAFNPAAAGTDNSFKIRLNSRMQWMGFDNAPVTNALSAYGPHKVRNIGYGGNINYDQVGPISLLRMNGAFAANFLVNFDIRVSFGLNLGLLQYRADGTQFEFYDPDVDDLRAPHAVMANFRPDAGAGMFVYHHDWYVGFSAQQLFNNNLKLTATGEDSKRNRLRTHFYGIAGYRISEINKRWVIEPSVLVRKVVANPMQLDIAGRIIYRQQFWGGLCISNTFESFNDLCLIAGYIHDRKISVSIAYDYSFSKIRSYTAGTIELMLGYNFDAFKRGR
jgi:type IX secretion system PorP/SprF family membrane protein